VLTIFTGASVALAVALFGSGGPAEKSGPFDPDAIFSTSETDLKLCFASGVSISPDARSLALIARHDVGGSEFKSPFRSGDISFVDRDCAASGKPNCKITRFSSLSAVTGPLWGSEGEAFVFSGAQKIAQIRLGQMAAVSPPSPMSMASAFDIQATGRLPFRSAGEAAKSIDAMFKRAAEQAPGERIIALEIFAQGSVSWTAMNPATLTQRVFRAGRSVEAPAYPAAPDIRLVRAGRDRDALVGSGLLQHVSGTTVEPNQSTPWAAPFYDASKGELAGTFSMRDIKHENSNALNLLSDWMLLRKDTAIISLSYSSDRDVAAALMRSTSGQVSLAVSADGKIETALSECSNNLGGGGGAIDVSYLDLGSSGWPLPSVQYRHRGPSKGVVYYLHGGPGTKSGPFGYWHVVGQYLGRGLDVVVIDPSSSIAVGPNIATRIATQGGASIERDAAIMVGAMQKDRAASNRVVLHAESFGAVFALSPVVTKFHPSASILVAPWLSSDATLERAPPTKLQRMTEGRLLGDRAGGFFAWHRQAIKNWVPGDDTYVIFAAKDPLSQSADIPEAAASRLRSVELSNTSHSRIYGHPGTWATIDSALASAGMSPAQ